MKYKSIELAAQKQLKEVKSVADRKLLADVLHRVTLLRAADAGNVDALIELGEQILGTEND